ncbi:MAG: non-homologous end-joining DNA ligase [Egibacteraceae bacterium]
MSDAPELTHPDKVLWPVAGVTKADLAAYFDRVAERMLPHVRDRPLALKRHPRGVDQHGFFHKNLRGAPAWLPRHTVWTPSSDRTVTYPMVASRRDLAWLAQQNTVELHPLQVLAERDDRPDILAFDLDPSDASVSAATAGRWLRETLDELGLGALVKTSGKRGLHVFVRVERRWDHARLRGFGLAVARACADRRPEALTVAMRKEDRGDRLLLDWSRNGHAQHLVAVWSPRTTPTATVSVPLAWDEVTDDLDPEAFTIRTAPDRPDHWAELPRPQRLERAEAILERAGYELADASPRSRVR